MGEPAYAKAPVAIDLLVLSFDELLRRVGAGGIGPDDFAHALFYLESRRENVFRPSDGGPLFDRVRRLYPFDMERGWAAHRVILEGLRAAEADGRVAWRPDKGQRDYASVGELFRRNGLPQPFSLDDPAVVSGLAFFDQVVVEAVRRVEPLMDVLCASSVER